MIDRFDIQGKSIRSIAIVVWNVILMRAAGLAWRMTAMPDGSWAQG
jgi:hypothetical protein